MEGAHTPIPFLATPADETSAAFSPDGKWIAYHLYPVCDRTRAAGSGRAGRYVSTPLPDAWYQTGPAAGPPAMRMGPPFAVNARGSNGCAMRTPLNWYRMYPARESLRDTQVAAPATANAIRRPSGGHGERIAERHALGWSELELRALDLGSRLAEMTPSEQREPRR